MAILAPAPQLLTLARFLLSGGLATLLHWALMAMLISLGTDATVGTAFGAAVGALSNYFLQFHLTFSSRARHRRAVPMYLAASTLGWLANLLLFLALHDLIELGVLAAQGMTSLFVAALNFWLYKKVVFHAYTVATRTT